jgi:hypothetical protein
MNKKKNGWDRTKEGYKFYMAGECEEEYKIKKVENGHFHIFQLDAKNETNLNKDFPTKVEAEHWLAQKVKENEDVKSEDEE